MFHDEHSLVHPVYVAGTQNPLLHISPLPQPINPNSKHESPSKFPHTLYEKSLVQNLSLVHSSTQGGMVVVGFIVVVVVDVLVTGNVVVVDDVGNVVVVDDGIVVVVDVVGLRVVVVVGKVVVVVVKIGMHLPKLHIVEDGHIVTSVHSKHGSESKFPQILNPL